MYAKEVLGDGEVVDRWCDSTVVKGVQCRFWGRGMKTYLFTTLAITPMHLPPLFLVPYHGIICVIQSAVCIRIYLKHSVDCFRLGPRVKGQRVDSLYLRCYTHFASLYRPRPLNCI